MKESKNPYATNKATVITRTANAAEPHSAKISGNDLRIKKGN